MMNFLKKIFLGFNSIGNKDSLDYTNKTKSNIDNRGFIVEGSGMSQAYILSTFNSKKARKLASLIKSSKKGLKSISSFEELYKEENQSLVNDIEKIDSYLSDFDGSITYEKSLRSIDLSKIEIDPFKYYEDFSALLISNYCTALNILKEFIASCKSSFLRDIRSHFRKIIQLLFKNLDDTHIYNLINKENYFNELILNPILNQTMYYGNKRNKAKYINIK
jgi:hypothetical protein